MNAKILEFALSEQCYTKMLSLSKKLGAKPKEVLVCGLELLFDSEFDDYFKVSTLVCFDELYDFVIKHKNTVKYRVRLTEHDEKTIKVLKDRYRITMTSQLISVAIYMFWSRQPENKTLVDDALKKMEIIRNWVREGL